MLDSGTTMLADADKGGRANGKETIRMARRRYQQGCLFKRGKRRKVWVARWREDVLAPDGTLERVLRSEVLGPVSEIPSQREARNIFERRLQPINEGRHRPQSTTRLAAFVVEQFEPGVLPTLKFATQQIYSHLLKKHLLPRFGEERLCDLSRATIQQFVLEKLKQGLAWETVNHLRHLLSKVLGTAVAWGYLQENFARGVKMPERTLKRPHGFLTGEQVRRLLAALDEPAKTIALLAVLAGLRIGEILGLRWGRIDLAAGTLRVEETCYKGKFGSPKSKASRREVPLAPIVVEALLTHRAHRVEDSPGVLVFATRSGTALAADNLRKRELAAACARAGIAPIDWHTLRHTNATLLHTAGTPLKVAQTLLGHSKSATTLEVYTHAPTEAQREAVAKLEGILFPNVPKLHQNAAGADEAALPIQ